MAAKRKRTRSRKQEHRLRVRSVRRDPPNMQKLGKVLIALAMAEAEREAQAERETQEEQTERTHRPRNASGKAGGDHGE